MDKVKYLPIINRSDSCKLAVSDICYISRNHRKLQFDTDRGLLHTYAKMDDIEELLGPGFCRCMSGCIVNLAKVRELKDMTVYFETGESLRLGRDAYIKLKQRYNAYLLGLIPKHEG